MVLSKKLFFRFSILQLLFVWPRFFYLAIFGVGIGAHVMASAIGFLVSLKSVVFNSHLFENCIKGLKKSVSVLLLIFMYYTFRIFSDVIGDTPYESLKITIQDFVIYGGCAIVAAVIFDDPDRNRLVRRVITSTVYISSIAAIIEYVYQTPFLEVIGVWSFAAGEESKLVAISSASSDLTTGLRVKSLFSHPIVFAQFMACLTPFFIFYLRSQSVFTRIYSFLAIILILIDISLAQTRSGFVLIFASTSVAAGVYLLDSRSYAKILLLSFMLLVAIIGSPFIANISNDFILGSSQREISSSFARQRQISLGFAELQSSPLFGFGSGSSIKYAGIEGRNGVITVDNTYLSKAVEMGYIGVITFILLLIGIFWHIAKSCFLSRNNIERVTLASWAGVVAAYSIGASVVSIYDLLAFVFVGLGYSIASRGETLNSVAKAKNPDRSKKRIFGIETIG